MTNIEENIFRKANKLLGTINMTLDLKLENQWEYKKTNHLGGVQYSFSFKNGYGASVIKNFGSYGAKDDKWELAIMKNNELIEVPSVFDGVVKGWLTDLEVETILIKIQAL